MFSPEVGVAAVEVLENAGFAVQIPRQRTCCGLTWISTGQLDAAGRILSRTVSELLPHALAGVPIVGLEPSCTAVLRSEVLELIEPERAEPVARSVRTLAELLGAEQDWSPPSLAGEQIVAQPHCHHHAVMSWTADEALLAEAGAEVLRLNGCCGLAGNFGVEKGHYDMSVAVAEQHLLPAVRAAAWDTAVLADGFSCRTQLIDLTDRPSMHLAQLLARTINLAKEKSK